MIGRFIRVLRLLIVLASHRSLALENLALRQQLAMYRRTRPKLATRRSDRTPGTTRNDFGEEQPRVNNY